MSDNGKPKMPRKSMITYVLSGLAVLALATWEVFFHELESEHHWWARGICLVTFILATAAFVEHLRGFGLKRENDRERIKLQGEREAFAVERSDIADERARAKALLDQFIKADGHFLALDCRDSEGRISDRIREAFGLQVPGQAVVAVGSFNDSDAAPLSLKHLLDVRASFPNTYMIVIDTELPFARRDQLAAMLKQYQNLSFYAHHSPQVFDPILIFSTQILFSIMNWMIVVPIEGRTAQDEVKRFMDDLISNCFLMSPDFGKKLEYFIEVLPHLSRRVVESVKDDGYSFSAKHSGLWFTEPLKMTAEKVEDIKNEMDRDFKTFSDDILPISNRVIANWPLTKESDLSLISSESVSTWTTELRNQAEQRLAENPIAIRRYLYISADQKWDGKKNIIYVKGANWRDRVTNEEKDFHQIISLLRTNFMGTSENYQSYVVLVPTEDRMAFVDDLSHFAGQRQSSIQIEELLSNWIIFHSDRGLNILQYEKKFDYGVDPNGSSFYAFYYNDFIDHAAAASRRVERYLRYSELLSTAAGVAERKAASNPKGLKKERVHVLPIQVFFEWLDEGQVIVT